MVVSVQRSGVCRRYMKELCARMYDRCCASKCLITSSLWKKKKYIYIYNIVLYMFLCFIDLKNCTIHNLQITKYTIYFIVNSIGQLILTKCFNWLLPNSDIHKLPVIPIQPSFHK